MKTPTEVSAFLKSFALKNQSEMVRLAGGHYAFPYCPQTRME